MPSQSISNTTAGKYAALQTALRTPLDEGLLVAFSGGTDSSFLLWAAEQERRRHGGRLLAVTAVSASLAAVEKDDAARFAEWAQVEHRWIESGELANPAYVRNDGARCYHCKSELFRLSHSLATELGLGRIAYGYNASDRADVRPGQAAALEQNILAPLNDAQLTKDEIRELMRAFELPLADKPSSPCLSSRLMTGVAVTPQKLRDVEAIETILREAGLRVFRVRLHEDGEQTFLRIETSPAEMPVALVARERVVAAARSRGYRWVTLDLAGYRTGGATSVPPR